MADNSQSTDSNTGQADSSQDGSQGSRLAKFLEEFEKDKSSKAAPTGKAASSDDVAELKAEVERLTNAEADRQYRKEMDDYMVPTVKGELDVHPKLVEAWLNDQANLDPRLREIWEKRGEDRKAFEDAVANLKTDFEAYADKEGLRGTLGKIADDGDSRKKRAVRSARQTGDAGNAGVGKTPEELSNMSRSEFVLHQAEVIRQFQAGELTA